MQNRLCAAGTAILFALTLLHCSSSSGVIDSYRAPGTVSFTFERGVVIVLNGGPERRAMLEDEVVRIARRSRLIPAHTVLTGAGMSSTDAARQSLLDQKFDGIVVMRLLRPNEIDASASSPGEWFIT